MITNKYIKRNNNVQSEYNFLLFRNAVKAFSSNLLLSFMKEKNIEVATRTLRTTINPDPEKKIS